LFNYSGFELNITVQKTLDHLSNAALAMGAMNVGAGLRFSISTQYIKQMLFTAAVKLFVMPLITVSVLYIIGVKDTALAIGVLYSGLPCASTSYVLAKQLGGDFDLMASIITVTTLCALISLGFWMYFLS
jgi:predicted permease